MEDKYKCLEKAINEDPVLNEVQKNALLYVRRLSESSEQASLSYLQMTLPNDDIPAFIKCTTTMLLLIDSFFSCFRSTFDNTL